MTAEERLEDRLSLWEMARDEGASEQLRRRLLDEVGLILDEATETLRALQENLGEGLNHMAEPSPGGTLNPYWEEVRKIDTLYRELLSMLGDAGLSVRAKTPSDTAGLTQHELEVLTAS